MKVKLIGAAALVAALIVCALSGAFFTPAGHAQAALVALADPAVTSAPSVWWSLVFFFGMAFKEVWSPTDQIVPTSVAGGRARRFFSQMVSGVQSYGVLVVARARLRILNNVATLLRNRGSIWAAFTEVGVEENGVDTQRYDPRILRFTSEMFAGSAIRATRGAVGIATYNLVEAAMLWFSHPLSATPAEVTYIEKDAGKRLRVFATMVQDAGGGAGALVTPGVGGLGVDAILDQVALDVVQVYDPRTVGLPFFLPRVREITLPVAGANGRARFEIDSTDPIRWLILQQDSSLGEVADIITQIGLRGDGDTGTIIGPQQIAYDNAVRLSEFFFSGDVFGAAQPAAFVAGPGGLMGFNFQRAGRLSNLLNPKEITNLRFELGVTPTALAGATDSLVRLNICELVRIGGLVEPTVPFSV
jgi:hypothetical protein